MKKFRIPVGDFKVGKAEKEAIMEILDSGKLSEGTNVHEFEKRWAKFIGTEYCVATSSGSGALIAGLTALKHLKNLKDGTKVITSPVTYIATSSAISVVGFEPVYVDVGLNSFNISPESIKAHLEQVDNIEKYAIILPVHLLGYPLRMDGINEVARQYNLATFEDSAQAHGTTYGGARVGSMSLLSAFSFFIAHNIQVGEMGAVMTNDQAVAKLVRRIKAQGRKCDCFVCTRGGGWCPLLNDYNGEDDFDPRFSHDLIGYNFKTMEVQAALALGQIRKTEQIIRQRQENVKHLNTFLGGHSDVLQLPEYSSDVSYLAYPIVIKRPDLITRKELRMKLEKEGIETRPLFGCIPTQQPAYSYLKKRYIGKLPNAEYLGLNAFYIGCHQYVTENDLEYVGEVFDKVLSKEKLR